MRHRNFPADVCVRKENLMEIKRILSFIMALSLAVSAVSCGNYSDEPLKSGDQVSENSVTNISEKKLSGDYAKITLHYDEKKFCETDLTGAVPVAVTEDKIYYENFYGEEDQRESSGYIIDLSDSSVISDDSDVNDIGDIIYRDNDKIVYSKEPELISIISRDLSDRSEKTAEFENLCFVDADSSGNIYAIDNNYKIKYFNKSLEPKKEVDLTDQISGIEENGYYLTDMCVSDEGKIYIAFEIMYAYYSVYTIDENNNLVRATDDIPTDYLLGNIFTDSSGNIVLIGNDTVYVIEPKTGNTVCSYKLYGVSHFIGPSEKYDMVYMCSDGMYGYCYENDSKELIVSEDVLPDMAINFSSAYINGDKVHITLTKKSLSVLYETDRKTGETTKSECVGCSCSCIGTDGSFYYISCDRIVKGSEDEGTYVTMLNSVYRHEKDGSNTLLFKLPELHDGEFANGMIMNSSGELMISYEDEDRKACILVYDTAGSLKSTIYPENDNDYCALKLIKNENGKIYIGLDYYGDAPVKICSYDEKNYSIGEKYGELEPGYIYQNGTGDYDIILTDYNGIYGWKDETGRKTTIVRFSDFKSEHFDMYYSYVISENEIICRDGFELVKADEERLAALNSREVITVASADPSLINSFVSDFNKINDDVYILVKSYFSNDKNKSFSELFSDDIENNDIPDIVMMDDLDLASYIANGMFSDMREFADADPQFELKDIYEYITDAFTYNDCLYTIPAGIHQSVIFSDEQFGKWDYNDLISAETGDKDKFHYSYLVYHHLYKDIFTPYYNDHVDIQNKKCDFDSEEFISLIKHLKEIGITIEECRAISASENFLGNDYKLEAKYINSAYDYLDGTGKSQETESRPYVVGWPSESGGKRLIKPVLSFGITSKSEDKETAWEFVKYVINEANNNIKGGLLYVSDYCNIDFVSSDISVNEYNISEYLSRMYGETNYGFTEEDEKVYRDIYTMPVMTDMMYRKVSEIVNSELDEYFYSEDRTAEEVAESIQNKVTQYLNEIS